MKFKSILLALLFPLSLFGATNAFDNIKINTSLRFLGGTPALNEVLTSDGSGMATWQPLSAIGGGDVFTTSNNTFIATKTNTFNGVGLFTGSNAFSGPLSFHTGGGRVFSLQDNSWYTTGNSLVLELNARRAWDSASAISIDWDSKTLQSAGATSVNWASRTLNNSVGGAHLDWENRRMLGDSWTVTNDFNVQRNQTIGGLLSVSNKASLYNGSYTRGNAYIEDGFLNVSNMTSHVAAKFISGGMLISYNIVGGTNVGQFFREVYTGNNLAIDGATGKPKTEFNSYGGNAIGFNPDFSQTRMDFFGTSNVLAGSVMNHNMRLTAHNGNLDIYNGFLTVSNRIVGFGGINVITNIAPFVITNSSPALALNAIATHTGNRGFLSTGIILEPGIGIAAAEGFMVSGAVTNRYGPVSSAIAGTTIQQLNMDLQPNSTFWISNTSVAPGVVFIRTNSFNIRQF